ncbi:MAG: hypothetical protein ACJ8R9_12820 [Steroidobacteraceae bacterium]
MDSTSAGTVSRTPTLAQRPGALAPIVVGGLTAGALDATAAFITFGFGMPRGIASGLLGAKAFQGGITTWILGLLLHFSITLCAAAVYWLASRRLEFLRTHFFVCGLFYGIAVFLVMNLLVLPLSAVPFPVGPFTVAGLYQGLLAHMFLVGLPIAMSVRYLGR